MIQLLIKNGKGTFDITQLVPTVTWSGDYRQCARVLEFSMLSSQTDRNIPSVEMEPGAAVTLMQDETVLFMGMVVERHKTTQASLIDVTAYDGGIRLKNIKTSLSVSGQTPEQLTAGLCRRYGIPAGAFAETGFSITRNFFGVSLYQIIETAYTLAGRENGRKYQIRFRGQSLHVEEKKVNNQTLILENGVNLMDASMTDSVKDMVNQVVIYDKNDHPVNTVKDEEAIRLYGLMQGYIKQGDGDAKKEAEDLLEEKGVSQKITVNCLGNVANVTGGTVVVHEPYTGVYGLFFIDSDIHTWKNGQYYNKLTLNFKNIMDEQEAGSLPNRTGSKTAGKTAKKKGKTSKTAKKAAVDLTEEEKRKIAADKGG